MWIFKKAYYRTFQWVFNIGARLLHWRKAKRIEGPGCIEKIPELLNEMHISRPLVVTDPGLMEAGTAPTVLKLLEQAGIHYVLYDQVEANPSVKTVNAIYSLYKEEQCQGFIAVGGGSAMDAAKAAGARVARPRKTANQFGGLLRVLRPLPPFVAVPTTAGTGSETTIAALITDTDTHHKYAIMDLCLIPRYAVLDPLLTKGLPPNITAASGMDALSHAIEAYLCWTYNTKESIRFAEEAVIGIFKNLEKCCRDGSDIQARQEMLLASYKAGFAFTRAGVGNIHALAHTLSGFYNTPHGLANAVILPIVLDDYGKAVYKKLAHLADIAGILPPSSSSITPVADVMNMRGMTDRDKANAFIDEIKNMNARMGIPAGFDFIKDDDIPQMISWALKEANPLYPVPILYDRLRFRSILEKVRTGRPVHEIGSTCIGCGACLKVCPVFAVSGEKGQRHKINKARCVSCGACGRVCPKSAVLDPDGNYMASLPRSQWPKPQIIREKCSACGICVSACSAGAISISFPKRTNDIHVFAHLSAPEKCVACHLCAKECPLSLITMKQTDEGLLDAKPPAGLTGGDYNV